MLFQCNTSHTCGKKPWSGEILILSQSSYHKEAVITARGTYFHIITGHYQCGNYLCVPNMDFGCELSYRSDTFWNAERISRHLENPVDVETLVSGIKALDSIDETT
ncbi:MAG: hypothetical protein PUC65_12525 [Clostridiales bacterium]|nr:hypothetical protein [Clostridiales bacterium]